jgi:hypothetical protein
MVEVEWRLPLTRFRACFPSSSIGKCGMDNLRSGGAIRGSVEPSEGKDGESGIAILRFSM